MQVYDEAHALARALGECEEYRALVAAKKSLDEDEQAKKIVQDFLAKQLELQYAMMTGQKEDKGKQEQLERLYEILRLNAKADAYLTAHMKFQRLMADVYKIIGDAVAGGMDAFAK